MTNRKDLIRHLGRIWVLDEKAAAKKFLEVTVVDNIKVSYPVNRTSVKTTSGIEVFTSAEPEAMISFDLYHPGDAKTLDLIFRGPINYSQYDGSTAVTGEKANVSFGALGDCAVLPYYNGAKTAVTVTDIKSADGATTYTVTTDYTVAADAATGMTLITHVSGGAIPLNKDVVVTFSHTPPASRVIRPNFSGNIVDRFLVVDAIDPADSTKYRRHILPRATAESSIDLSLLESSSENANVGVLSVSMKLAKPDSYGYDPKWSWYDTIVAA